MKDSRYPRSRALTLCASSSFGGIATLARQHSFTRPSLITMLRLGSSRYRTAISLWTHPSMKNDYRLTGKDSQGFQKYLLQNDCMEVRHETQWNCYCKAAKMLNRTCFRIGRHTDSMERCDEIVYRDSCLFWSINVECTTWGRWSKLVSQLSCQPIGRVRLSSSLNSTLWQPLRDHLCPID